MDLYIYYKVRGEHAALLGPRVRAMQAALCARHGNSGQLKRRPDEQDGRQTWMEVYPDSGAGFAAALALAVNDAALGQWIDGPRHTEVFTDISTCV